jgi:hypothetical protein
MYTVLSIAGPKSKELMDEMTGTDMTMHPFTYREVNVGYASGVMVLAVTNTGQLYKPTKRTGTREKYDRGHPCNIFHLTAAIAGRSVKIFLP